MNIETLSHAELFNHLWQTKYAPEITDKLNREAQRRAESFANVPITVCGEELRLMTARDLLWLDGFENAFVTGAKIPTEEDVAFFLWTMNTKNTRGGGLMTSFRKGKLWGKFTGGNRDLAHDVAEIEEYCDRVFIGMEDQSQEQGVQQLEKKPAQVYFLAPLLINVAGSIGPRCPMDGELLADIPIPRLMQYAKAIRDKDPNNTNDETTAFDSQRSRCLEEVNQIFAERNRKTA
jgi:hypothetical protein